MLMGSRVEMIGRRFGRLRVLREAESHQDPSGRVRRSFEAQCDCGVVITAEGHALRSGNTGSCGCLQREKAGSRKIPMVGKQFSYWTVLSKAMDRTEQDQIQWLVRCKCGAERIVQGGSLRSGTSKSCGCYKIEVTVTRSTKHGEARRSALSAEYQVYRGMIARCSDPHHKAFKDYGGRGIQVCARWRTSYENFLADMGRRPTSKHSIDRYPDNDGNYEPGNVRWATASQQQKNKRRRAQTVVSGAVVR
jgi:hypothetical protein